MTMSYELNIPEVHAELTAAFNRYEDALVNNKVEILDELFWNAPTTMRFGVTENLWSYQEIQDFRAARPTYGLNRTLQNTRITTFGRDFGVANTEFRRESSNRIGRQSHTWVRTPEGWRIVSAHVSLMMDGPK
jgi:hypothetical protein